MKTKFAALKLAATSLLATTTVCSALVMLPQQKAKADLYAFNKEVSLKNTWYV